MIEADSPTMVFILKMATLKEIVGNTIAMSVEYTFHRDKLMNPETKRKLEIAFGQLLGSAIAIDVEVEKSTQGGSDSEQNAANNELTDLTAAFGGQVV
ncbi:MAG: hypothetical protein UV18_C0011G0037 [Candidatus Magasanikbacteria bacterium GW2011_GWC2_42_27]|nr:MAG: hypothetical protein UV18_C0011G0037 [Candidatus Magasanikbacteria bacterium GW2011_GWC2_42_27]